MLVNQVLFAVSSRGVSTWRGQQYSLALFPIWIRAVTSAVANVCFGRPLGFVVTSKTRQEGNQWGLVRVQLVLAGALLLSTVIGVTRLVLGVGEPIGTLVNVAWVVFDLIVLSVLVPAARFQGFECKEESA
jgi:cellulose synthase (UDP-forming)